LPVGLADDPDAISGGFEHPAEDRHRKAGVVDVSISGDEDHIEFVPASVSGLLHRHRQWEFGKRTVGLSLAKII
jgi:hypothetical protein